jgi:hypothetical protein
MIVKKYTLACLVLLLMSWTLSCSSKDDSKTETESTQLETAAVDSARSDALKNKLAYQDTGILWHFEGDSIKLGGMVIVPPLEWDAVEPTEGSAIRFSLAPIDDEPEPAITEILLLGKDGQSYEAIKDRLLSRMSMPGGRAPETAVVEHDRMVDGMMYHAASIMGTYAPSEWGPGVGILSGGDDYRVIGIVMAGPEGDVLFTLAGPDQTARAMIEAFMRMIWQIKRIA